MTTATEARTAMMEKIRKLIDKADSTPFGEEADTLREKADELMTKFAIEAWQMDRHRPKEQRIKPEMREIVICQGMDLLEDQLTTLLGHLVYHRDCRWAIWGRHSKFKSMPVKGKIVGFPEDLDFIEMLFTSLRMHMSKDLSVEVDPSVPRPEMVYRMKSAGMKWVDICRKFGITYETPEGRPTTERNRIFGEYKKYCKDHDFEMISVPPNNFVRSFATGFAERIADRLYKIRQAQMQDDGVRVSGSSTDLVLRSREQEASDAFNEMFPNLGRGTSNNKFKYASSASVAGRNSADSADLGSTRLGRKKELS